MDEKRIWVAQKAVQWFGYAAQNLVLFVTVEKKTFRGYLKAFPETSGPDPGPPNATVPWPNGTIGKNLCSDPKDSKGLAPRIDDYSPINPPTVNGRTRKTMNSVNINNRTLSGPVRCSERKRKRDLERCSAGKN
jgi:hypothetical protein